MREIPAGSSGHRENEKIRIAFVIDTLFYPAGGTEGQLLQLLERIDRDRFEPSVFCLRPSDWLAKGLDRTPVTVLDLHLSRDPALIGRIWAFSRILRRQRFHIVQTHFRDSNIVGVLGGSLARIDVIISTRRGLPYWRNRVDLWFLKWLNRRVTWFLANCRATRDRFAQSEGFDLRRVEIIYNGLDPDRFRSLSNGERIALKQSLGLALDAPIVGIVANLRRVKGIDDFIEAARLVSETQPAARFLVVGAGSQEEALRDLARRSRLEERLCFLGARQDVADLLQILDVGVLASHSESFSNSILEYLAAGLPVVVTDVGGAREAVREGRDGFIVPPRQPAQMAEKISFLLGHPGGARSWREDDGIRSIFHVDSMVREHEQLYERLFAERTLR